MGSGARGMESPTEEGDLVWWLAIAAVMSLAAALRFQNLAMASLWLDEAFSWSQARLPFWDMIKETAGDGHLPLQNTVLYLTIRAFGDSEGVLRTPSAIYGVVNVAAIYWVGAILGGRGVGIVSAILLTLSGVDIWQSQDVRPYALLALTSTLYMGATYRALETGRRQWQAASAVAALMLLLSHVYGLFLWLSIVAAVLAARYLWRKSTPHHRAWLFWQCVPAVLFIPWTAALYHRYMQIIAWGFWISKPTPRRIVELVSGLSSGGALAILLLLGTIWGYVTIGRNDERRAWRFSVRLSIDRDRFLLLAWLLGPFLIGFVLSWISQPILVYRYVIGSLPAFFIAASIGLWRLLGHRPLFAICATALAANLTSWILLHPEKENRLARPRRNL